MRSAGRPRMKMNNGKDSLIRLAFELGIYEGVGSGRVMMYRKIVTIGVLALQVALDKDFMLEFVNKMIMNAHI